MYILCRQLLLGIIAALEWWILFTDIIDLCSNVCLVSLSLSTRHKSLLYPPQPHSSGATRASGAAVGQRVSARPETRAHRGDRCTIASRRFLPPPLPSEWWRVGGGRDALADSVPLRASAPAAAPFHQSSLSLRPIQGSHADEFSLIYSAIHPSLPPLFGAPYWRFIRVQYCSPLCKLIFSLTLTVFIPRQLAILFWGSTTLSLLSIIEFHFLF